MKPSIRVALAGAVAAACCAVAYFLLRAHPAASPAPAGPPHFDSTFELTRFFRGNIHTHTNLSDGKAPPEDVAAWYRAHGYAFLAITDHNLVTAPELAARLSSPGFIVLRGEEVSMYHHGKQVHANAVCTRSTVGGGDFPDASSALTRAIRLIREQNGIALINHPNFDSAITPADVPSFAGAHFIEVASGHEYVNSAGDETHPSHEQLWDHALSAGVDLMAAAVDDMHCLQAPGDPPAYPGKGWMYLAASSLDEPSICRALAARMVVASTGPAPRRVAVSADRYEVEPEDPAAAVVFVGNGGRELSRGARSYQLRGDEGYVRARIESSDGKRAWTPAVRVVR